MAISEKIPMLLLRVSVILLTIAVMLLAYSDNYILYLIDLQQRQYYEAREDVFELGSELSQLETRLRRLKGTIEPITPETQYEYGGYGGAPPRTDFLRQNPVAEIGLPSDICDRFPPTTNYKYNYSEAFYRTDTGVVGRFTLICTYFRECGETDWCKEHPYTKAPRFYPDVRLHLYVENNTVYDDVFIPLGQIEVTE